MPLEFKKGFDSSKYIREASRRRASDEAHREFSEAELDRRARATLVLRSTRPAMPPAIPGGVLNSITWAGWLRDMKMTISSVASQGEGVEEEINFSTEKNFAVLDDLQREALALDAQVTEEEVKINGRYSQVHFNSFVRQEDAPRPYDDSEWLTDWKTGLPFQADNMMDMLPGTGLTLPLREEVPVRINSVTLVGEETDVGDTRWPIVSTHPNSLLEKGRAFRHVIIRTDHDKTSRKYNHTPSFCTLLLNLSSLQLVNSFTVRPLGHSTVYVDSLSYINEAGEEVELTEVELSGETALTVLFEPIRTQHLKVRFRQYAPVTRQFYEAGDIRVRELNKLMRGAQFSQLLPEESQEIQGRVYDFSLESVEVSLRAYENLGVYRSQPLDVSGPIGATLTDIVETIQISNDSRTYGTTFFLNEGEVLLERYLGVDLKWPEGGRAFRELIPMPDSRSVQREFLPIFSGVSSAKLFPDMMWNVEKIYISDVSYAAGGVATITFVNPHELVRPVGEKQTDRIWIISGPGSEVNDYNFYSEDWQVVDEQTIVAITIGVDSGSPSGSFENVKISPYMFVVRGQPEPLTVYREDEALAIGADYLISIDRGTTWLGAWPRNKQWFAIKAAAEAGQFKIKLTSPDHNKIYWVQYRPLGNQTLSRRAGVRLRNGRVVFDRRFQGASGTLSTVIVARADNVNAYLTPVVLSYFLRVREHVS